MSIAADYSEQLKAEGRLTFRYVDMTDTYALCGTFSDSFDSLFVSIGFEIMPVINGSELKKQADKRFSPESFVNAVYENNTADDSLNIVTLED